MIKFYFHPSPNPLKIALYLEETGEPYELIPVDTRKGDQHSDAFKAINPNAKTPAMLDDDIRVFDSNAMLLYLAEKIGKFVPADTPKNKAEMYSWLMFVATGSQYFRPFWELTRLSLEYTLDRLKLERQSGQVEKLMQQYAHLTPFTENLAVLQKIKDMGLTTAILSNGSIDMLNSAVKSAGMAGVLDHIISVDPVRLFKTSPESYGLVQQSISVNKDEVLFVSSNAWDALGATWFGFTTHWVNRQGLPFEALTPQPHFSGADLNSVLASLGSPETGTGVG